MSRLGVDLFVEDRGHEEFVRPLVERLAHEEETTITLQVRTARGGHGRVLTELELYQSLCLKGLVPRSDLLVVAIDGNCKSFQDARDDVRTGLEEVFHPTTVIGCPDPHVELWYMADPTSFRRVVGAIPQLGPKKCERGRYKEILRETVREAGHVPMLGGLEFARDVVMEMDLYRAGKNHRSLQAFITDVRNAFRTAD